MQTCGLCGKSAVRFCPEDLDSIKVLRVWAVRRVEYISVCTRCQHDKSGKIERCKAHFIKRKRSEI